MIIDPKIKVWKSVRLGTSAKMTSADFRRDIEVHGCLVQSEAMEVLTRVRSATQRTDVDLAVVSVADLRFYDAAPLVDIYACARVLGLGCCHPEVGPRLRAGYAGQCHKERLFIAMDPLCDLKWNPRIFCVLRDSRGLWLSAIPAGPTRFFEPKTKFVFEIGKPLIAKTGAYLQVAKSA